MKAFTEVVELDIVLVKLLEFKVLDVESITEVVESTENVKVSLVEVAELDIILAKLLEFKVLDVESITAVVVDVVELMENVIVSLVELFEVRVVKELIDVKVLLKIVVNSVVVELEFV